MLFIPDSPTKALSGSNQKRHLAAKQEIFTRNVLEFSYKYLFHGVGIFNML
jgi:hypothetical protein